MSIGITDEMDFLAEADRVAGGARGWAEGRTRII